MKNVLVITDKIYPDVGANELCILKLLRTSNDLNVSIVCCTFSRTNNYRMDDYKVYPVQIQREIPFKKRKNFFEKINYVIKHISNCFVSEPVDIVIARNLYHYADTLIQNDGIDTVISVINPPEAAEAGFMLKKKYPRLTFIIYDLDTVSNCSNGIIERKLYYFYSKQVIKWEKKVFSSADLLIHLTQHSLHFSKATYREFENKTIFQDLPLLEPSEMTNLVQNSCPVLIYSGSFYNRLREPEKLLFPFIKLSEVIKFELHVYTNAEYTKILRDKYAKYEFLKIHYYIKETELKEKIKQSDYLVSLGNSYSDMFPSKIVMYASMLKPIIHIVQQKNDPVTLFLDKYPDKLILDINDEDKHVHQLKNFMCKKHKEISRDTVTGLYKSYSPEYCMRMIEEKLDEQDQNGN